MENKIKELEEKLLRKEQECEELKVNNNQFIKDNEFLAKRNSKLKAENDELKKKVYKYEQAEKYPAAFLWQEGLL